MKATTALFWLLPALATAQTATTAAPPAWETGVETQDGYCGASVKGVVCTPTWGACCGVDGECGRGDTYCGVGCQPLYGNCNVVVAPPATPTPGSVSPDGSCGGTNQFKCVNSSFGDCCSSSGFCGSTAGHCEAGCQTSFGTCSSVAGNVTTNGQCGANGKTCVGGSFGDCCSSGGWCGSTEMHCSAGCQESFGNCPSVTSASPSATPTSNVSTDGRCGAVGGSKTCKGSIFGGCCSSGGWCGSSDEHCKAAGCQTSFGECLIPSSTSVTASSTPSSNVSTSGQCGVNGGSKICNGSTFGSCCSNSGWCGATSDHCLAVNCNPTFGTCDAAISSSKTSTTSSKTASATPTPTNNISTNGSCGGTEKKTCLKSTFGNCCSSSGWCGTGSDFCAAINCNPLFGSCDAAPSTTKTSTTTTKTATPTPTSNVSTNGSCGGSDKKTCLGSTFGNCCSSSNFCGSDSAFCGSGCQSGFGTCSAPNTISTDGACSSNSKTCKGSSFGECCSSNNFCGSTTAHCGTGCKASFGVCSTAGTVSTDGACGTRNGKSCVGSTFGSCCSSTGYCGASTNHCGQGCQKGSSSACLTKDIPSMDGTCGSKVNLTCAGGSFNGQCCSSSGFCGSATTFCGTGCQKGFGKCT